MIALFIFVISLFTTSMASFCPIGNYEITRSLCGINNCCCQSGPNFNGEVNIKCTDAYQCCRGRCATFGCLDRRPNYPFAGCLNGWGKNGTCYPDEGNCCCVRSNQGMAEISCRNSQACSAAGGLCRTALFNNF